MTAIEFTVADRIATITLNRPGSLNAFDAEMARMWAEATTAATGDADVDAIVILGNGRAFCAGGDVRAMAELSERGAAMTTLAHQINSGIQALVESATPVVAGAHGATVGGGLGILLASDFAVVGEGSTIGSLYANVGLTPDLSVSALLGRAVGERRALQLTLADRVLTADEAREWGLAAEVVPDDAVAARAREVARHWTESAHAYGNAKRLLRSQPDRSFVEQLAEEARSIGAAAQTPQADARLRAFGSR